MELTWSKQMSVGNKTLDSEHKNLLNLVREVDRAIRAKETVRFAETIHHLKDATRKHFDNETKIALAIKYNFDVHQLEHQYILKEMQTLEDELASCHDQWSESIVEHYFQFLSNWAIDHINEDDMKMKALLESRPYDFKPDGLIS
jgi:hemerythrin